MYHIDNETYMAKTSGNVNVRMDRDVANVLLKMKEVGDTYSDVVRKLLKDAGHM